MLVTMHYNLFAAIEIAMQVGLTSHIQSLRKELKKTEEKKKKRHDADD